MRSRQGTSRLVVRLLTATLLVAAAPGAEAGDRALALLSLETGNTLLASGETEAALAQFEESLGHDPELARAHHHRGLALARLGRVEEAIESLESAVDLAPDDTAVHFDLALAYLANGDLFWASDEIVAAAELEPDDPQIALYEGRILFELDELAAAEEAFRRCADAPEVADAAGFYLGMTALRRGQREAAREHLESVETLEARSEYTRAADDATDRLLRAEWDIPPTFSGFFTLGSQYDSNVILEPDSVARPLGAESGGFMLRGGLAVAPVASAEHLLSGNLLAARTFYLAEPPDQFNLTTASVGARYRYRFPAGGFTHTLAVTASYDVTFLDGGDLADEPDFYAYTEGVSGFARYDLDQGERYRIAVETGWRHAVFSDMRRDSESLRVRLGPTLSWLEGRLKLMLSGIFRYDNARGRGFDLWGVGGAIGLSALAPWQLEPRGIASYTRHDHFDSAFYSGWGSGRRDDIVSMTLGLRRTVWDPVSADLSWTYTGHGSTTATYDYQRHLVALTLTVRLP